MSRRHGSPYATLAERANAAKVAVCAAAALAAAFAPIHAAAELSLEVGGDYAAGDAVVITGTVANSPAGYAVTLQFWDGEGGLIGAAQAEPGADGSFRYEAGRFGPGSYSVMAHHELGGVAQASFFVSEKFVPAPEPEPTPEPEPEPAPEPEPEPGPTPEPAERDVLLELLNDFGKFWSTFTHFAPTVFLIFTPAFIIIIVAAYRARKKSAATRQKRQYAIGPENVHYDGGTLPDLEPYRIKPGGTIPPADAATGAGGAATYAPPRREKTTRADASVQSGGSSAKIPAGVLVVLDTSVCIAYMAYKMPGPLSEYLKKEDKKKIRESLLDEIEAAALEERVALPKRAITEIHGKLTGLLEKGGFDEVARTRLKREFIEKMLPTERAQDFGNGVEPDANDVDGADAMFNSFEKHVLVRKTIKTWKEKEDERGRKMWPPPRGDVEIMAAALTLSRKRPVCLLAMDRHFTELSEVIEESKGVKIVSGFKR